MTRYVLRPCWTVGLTCLLVFLICPWIAVPWWGACAAVAAVVLIVALLIPFLRRIHAIPLLAATILVAIALFYGAWVQRVAPVQPCLNEPLTLTVRVMQSGERVLLTTEDGALANGTQLVFYPSDAELSLSVSDRFTTSFVLEEYTDGSYRSLLMRRASGVWLRAKRVDMDTLCDTLTVDDAYKPSLLTRVRHALVSIPTQQLQGDIGATIAGICYGADGALSDEASQAFRACGVSHLFAVSGLHMTILLQALRWLLHRARVPRMGRWILSGSFIFAFMLLVGFSPSVVRAGTLCLVVLLGDGLKREADTRNSLGIALLILLVADPFAAYDVGLLLSFSATYGLLCLSHPIQSVLLCGTLPPMIEKIRKPIASTVAVSLAATIATLPVMAIYFGRVSLVALVANLFTTLPASVALITGLLGSVLSVMRITVIAEPLMWIAGLMSRYLLWVCEKFSTFLLATVAISATFLLLWMIGTYGIWAIACRLLGKYGRAVLGGVCAIVLCAGILLNRGAGWDSLAVTCASAKDMAAVVTYRGSTVVVAAPTETTSLYRLRDVLQEQAVVKVAAICLIGGTEPILSYLPSILDEYIGPRTHVLYDSLPWHSPLAGHSLAEQAVTLGDALTVTRCGDHIEMTWDTCTLVFGAVPPTTCEADAVFCTGETPMTVITKDGPLALPVESGSVVYRNGQWFVRGNTR